MGERLDLDPNDPFFETSSFTVKGAAGSCYCCGQQIHVPFKHMEELPIAKINKEHFYVFICDLCEEDIGILNESGIEKVSYDILSGIQESLANELFLLEQKDGVVSSIEREVILVHLYKTQLEK